MTDQPERIDNKPRRRGRRFGFWMLASVTLLSVLLFILGLSISGRSISAPDWVTARVIKRVNAVLPSGHITMGRLQFQIDGDGVPRIFLGDMGVFDDRGAEVVRLNDIGARFSVDALFGREIKPDLISLSGAQMTLRRRSDGQFDISFGTGTTTTGTLPDMFDFIDTVLATSPLDQVSFLGAEDLTISLEDARSGRIWQITEGAMQLRRGDDGLDITVAFDVFNGTEELAEVIIGIATDHSSPRVSIGTTFKNAASADLALQSPVLSFLGVLNAPISGSLRTGFDENGKLGTLTGSLEIAEGALQPNAQAPPIGFSSAKSYFNFEPASQKIEFTEVSFESDNASITAQGHAYLRDLQEGWPSVLLGQFSLSNLSAAPEGMFEQGISFSQGAADIRVRLSPFSIDIGQMVLVEGDEKLVASGRVAANDAGWVVDTDIALNQISHDRLLSYWPLGFSPNTRNWLVDHLSQGNFSNVKAALRFRPDQPARRQVGWDFKDTNVRYINAQPEIEHADGYALIDGNEFTLIVDKGTITPPKGGPIEMGGTTIQIPDVTSKPAPIEIRLKGQSTNTAVLSLLDEPPFRVLRNTTMPVDVSSGQAHFEAAIDFDLKRKVQKEDIRYDVTADLQSVSSDKLVSGHRITADHLHLVGSNYFLEISGPLKLGQVAADMVWRQELTADAPGKSSVNGTVQLSQAFIREFGIGLPDNAVKGTGAAEFSLNLQRDEVPSFTLHSDLNRIGLQIKQIGWTKPQNATGTLEVAGTLGETPKIDLLEINAAGLRTRGGSVSMASNGSMQEARFNRVQVGGWLDAPVILRGRGAGVVPSVILNSGTIDIRKTAFGGAGGSTGGAGGPISLSMDRVIVSEGMVLTDFVGDFDSSGGLSGRFDARMNGKSRLAGELKPEKNGTAITIQSTNAGAVLRDAGVVEYADGGSLNLTLLPRLENGVYSGNMKIKSTKVKNAPGMTDLLAAISIVGLLEQLSGSGILFETVEADFELSPTNVHLTRSSAVGPSLGVSLEGIYDLTTSSMNMQGVVSPVYFLNGIGQIFSRRGEGLFGFNFKIKGTSETPKVSVNPLSILTPGVFRDLFRSPPPKPAE